MHILPIYLLLFDSIYTLFLNPFASIPDYYAHRNNEVLVTFCPTDDPTIDSFTLNMLRDTPYHEVSLSSFPSSFFSDYF